MPESINSKIKEQYDHDDSGGSLDTNLGDFLDSEGASGTSNNTKWRNWAEGTGTSLNTRLFHKHGGSGSFMTRWKNWIAFSSTHSFNFDGSNDYLDCGDSLGNSLGTTTALTLSVWVKNDNSSQDAGVFKIGETGSTNGNFTLSYANSHYYFAVDTNDSTPEATIAINNTVTNAFQHIVCVYNGTSQLKIYLNGVDQSLNVDIGTEPSSINLTGNNTFIGRYYSNEWDGLIDEVAIWDTVLSASDVTSIYNNGKVIDLSKSASYGTDRTANLKLWLRCGDKAEPESTTAIARQDFYTDFDGTNDYVVTPKVSLDFTNISIVMWINADSFSSDDIFFAIADADSNDEELILFNDNSDSDKFSVFFPQGSSENVSSGTIPTGSWTHLALTKSGTALKMYVNGSEVFSGSYTNTNTYSRNIIIGARKTSSYTQYFNGKISNLAIHQTALDSQTISQMAKSRFTPMRDNRFSVVDFDGSDDYIKVDANSSINSLFATGGTFSAWVNVGSAGEDSNGRVAEKGFFIYTTIPSGSTCKLGFYVPFSTTAGGWLTTNHDINFNEWQHIAITYDGSSTSNNASIYINGISVAVTESSTPAGTISADTANLYISNNSATTRSFNGSMSSVAVYNTAKSAEEVYAIYQQGITYDESSLSGLVGYWRMGSDTSAVYPTIADSSSNSNDGTITNGASDDIVQQMVAGYDMGAFESTEELGEELIENGVISTNQFTLNPTYDAGTGKGVTLNNGTVRIRTAGNTAVYIEDNNLFESGALYKIVAVVSNATAGDLYFRGGNVYVLNQASTVGTHIIYLISDGTSFIIARDESTVDISISSLSVKKVFQSDLSDTYPAIIDVNEPVLGGELVTNGSFDSDSSWTKGTGWTIGSGVATSDSSAQSATSYLKSTSFTALDVSTTYKLSFRRVQTNTGSLVMLGLGGSDTTIATYTTTTTGTDEIVYFQPSGANTSLWVTSGDGNFSGSVDNISLKEVSGNVGTMTNQDSADLVYSSVLPDQSFLATGVNSAYNFIDLDGTDDLINIGSDDSIDNIFVGGATIMAWIKPSSDGENDLGRIFDKSDATSGDEGWHFLVRSESGGVCDLRFAHGWSTTQGRWDTENREVNINEWNHVAITYDNSSVSNNASIFVNGISVAVDEDVTPSGTVANDSSRNLFIGNNTGGDRSFAGGIAGIALWGKSLSALEISAIYTAGRHFNLLDNYSDNLKAYFACGLLDATSGFKDTSSTIYDRSGNSNHGTVSGATLKSPPNAEPNGYAKQDSNRTTTTP